MSAQLQELWRLYPLHEDHLRQVMYIEQRAYEFPWSVGNFTDCLRSGYSAWAVENPYQELLAYGLMSMGAGEAHILNLCVAPEYQGQGLGRFLLEHFVGVARAAGTGLLLLEVRVSNAAALGLYLRSGFSELGRRPAYYPAKNGREDAIVLGLNLDER